MEIIGEQKALEIMQGLAFHPEMSFFAEGSNLAEIAVYLRDIQVPNNADKSGTPLKLPYNPVRFASGNGRFEYEISPRRFIYPGQMNHKFMCEMQRTMIDFIRHNLRVFYSNGLLRKMQDDKDMIARLNSSGKENPSVLLRVQFMDKARLTSAGVESEPYFMATLPVLLIPGFEKDPKVLDFCRDNSVYKIGYRAPGRHISQLSSILSPRITKDEYQMQIPDSDAEVNIFS